MLFRGEFLSDKFLFNISVPRAYSTAPIQKWPYIIGPEKLEY